MQVGHRVATAAGLWNQSRLRGATHLAAALHAVVAGKDMGSSEVRGELHRRNVRRVLEGIQGPGTQSNHSHI